MRNYRKIIFIIFIFMSSIIIAPVVIGAELMIISIDQLMLMMDKPGVVIIDVRESEDWKSNNLKIKGAVRRQPNKFATWSNDFTNNSALILY